MEQSQDKIYTNAIDEVFDYADRFLEGARATVFTPNAMRASRRSRNLCLNFNQTIQYYNDPVGWYDAYVFNMTRLISTDGADTFGELYTAGYNIYSYIMRRISQFSSWINLLTSFVQNLVANIINFNSVYNNIVAALNAKKY